MWGGGAGEQGGGYRTRLEPAPGYPDAAHHWDETYLGPELPRDQWWQVKDEGRRQKSEEDVDSVDGTQRNADQRKSARDQRHQRPIKEPAPTFELESRSQQQPQPEMRMAERPGQPALITGFTPPEGSRSQRLKQVMTLGDRVKANREDAAAISGLAAALGDSDDSIRWLAGSALGYLGGAGVVRTLSRS